MQLQLLKLESEDYVEGPMTVSDEDGEEVSPGMLAADTGLCLRTEDSWECSYIIDVLSESGIDGVHLDTILEVWHSLECPVSLSVFDELEERYSDGTACSRSQRRLLFDNINIGILKISEQFSFSRSAIRNAIGSNLTKKGFRDGLLRMLVDEGKVRDGGQGNVVVGESEWMDLKVYIDTIAREVERSLLDDLVAEIIGI